MARPKPTTTARGYGNPHQRERDRWEPKVKAGLVECQANVCLHASRAITPDADWDLGHTPDRTRWTGPEHRLCNRSEGGKRGAAVTNGQRMALKHSRDW